MATFMIRDCDDSMVQIRAEEIGELLNECYKRHFVDPEYGEVEDELADVFVILGQIGLYFNLIIKVNSKK